jgi:hypothetical protein
MKDVNGVQLKVGQKVYDLSVEATVETYGPLDEIVEILDDGVLLDNGKKINWKGVGYFVPVAVEK